MGVDTVGHLSLSLFLRMNALFPFGLKVFSLRSERRLMSLLPSFAQQERRASRGERQDGVKSLLPTKKPPPPEQNRREQPLLGCLSSQ